MPHAIYLMPTAIPGLSLACVSRQIIHDASGLCVAILPDGLSLSESTGLRRGREPMNPAWPLEPLSIQDWRGPISAAHQMVLNTVNPHYVSAQTARAYGERHARIKSGVVALSKMMRGQRGMDLNMAYIALKEARSARNSAVKPAEKGQATRMEKAAAEALSLSGMTAAQMDHFARTDTPPRLWIEAMNRVDEQQRAAHRYRGGHVIDCQCAAERFLVEQAGKGGVVDELRVCLMITSDLSNVAGAAYRKPYVWNEVHAAYLKTANTERVRRMQAGESLDPGDFSVRALTRPARLDAASQTIRSRNDVMRTLDRVCNGFTAAARFKTRTVRVGHYQAAHTHLCETYPSAGQQRAVGRMIQRQLLGAGRYGLPPVTLSEIPMFQRPKQVMPTLL